MYCCADVHFIVFYLVALRDAFSKVQERELVRTVRVCVNGMRMSGLRGQRGLGAVMIIFTR